MSNQKKRAYRSSARAEQAAKTRSRILFSAKKLFQEKGFESVTIGELAESAAVSSPTVYSLFKSKRGVLLALMDEALSPSVFEALVEEVKQEETAEGKCCVAAKMTRLLYEAEHKQLEFLRGASIIGPEFQKIEKEQEERRYERQKETINVMFRQSLLVKGMTIIQARDILWVFTGREMYRLFVIVRGWSPKKYETWLAETLVKLLAKRDSE